MKIIRFLGDDSKQHYGVQHDGASVTEIEGDLFGEFRDSGTKVTVQKVLAPIEPPDVLCIGLNYRRHAEEGNSPIPERPGTVHENQHCDPESG